MAPGRKEKRVRPNKFRLAAAVTSFRTLHDRWVASDASSPDEDADHRAVMLDGLSKSLLPLATLGTSTRKDERAMARELHGGNLRLEDLALVFDPLETGDVPTEPGALLAVVRAFGSLPERSEEAHRVRAKFRTLLRTEGMGVITNSGDRADRLVRDGLDEQQCGASGCSYCR